MAYPQGYLYQPSASLALYSCPAYSTSVISGPRTEELGRSSSGSAFAPYAGSTAFTSASPGYNSHLQYSADAAAAATFTSYVVSRFKLIHEPTVEQKRKKKGNKVVPNFWVFAYFVRSCWELCVTRKKKRMDKITETFSQAKTNKKSYLKKIFCYYRSNGNYYFYKKSAEVCLLMTDSKSAELRALLVS